MGFRATGEWGRCQRHVGVLLAHTLSFTDQWIKCDDDKLSIVTDEEILKLSGGGEWMAGPLYHCYPDMDDIDIAACHTVTNSVRGIELLGGACPRSRENEGGAAPDKN